MTVTTSRSLVSVVRLDEYPNTGELSREISAALKQFRAYVATVIIVKRTDHAAYGAVHKSLDLGLVYIALFR